MSIVVYNKIPQELPQLHGEVFMTKLGKWLIEKCFYGIKYFLEYIE